MKFTQMYWLSSWWTNEQDKIGCTLRDNSKCPGLADKDGYVDVNTIRFQGSVKEINDFFLVNGRLELEI